MAYDKTVDSAKLNADLASVANAIRAKSGGDSPLAFPSGFVSEVDSIQTGGAVTPLNVTQNGTYTAPAGEGYSPVTVNVNSGGDADPSKPVKFIDYDGTLLHSYTVAEFQELTELPENPTHAGLTSQGWNWTLAQAKAQLTNMPDAGLTVGQMYITDDGKTRIYCRFETGRLAPYLGLGVNGTVEVDWGDGSSTDTLTGTSLTVASTVQHTYSEAGSYVITLTVYSGRFEFFGTSDVAHILKKSDAATANVSNVYANAVQRVEMGANADLGNYAFRYCCNLVSITIPDGMTNIGVNAFQNCHDLTFITIPDGVTSINSNTFQNCYNLASITIPDSMTYIGSNAFMNCHGLISITIPDGVTGIGVKTFQNCSSLASITIPDGVTLIYSSMFQSCSSLASVTIPDGVTSIDGSSFYCCYNLSSIMIPDSVTSIGSSAFYYCYSLASITIPDDATFIGSNAFQNCYGLASITIPDGVTLIGSSAFQNCYGLGEVHFLSTTPPTVSASNVFQNLQTDCKIYVPAGTLAAYTSATNYPSSSIYTYLEE